MYFLRGALNKTSSINARRNAKRVPETPPRGTPASGRLSGGVLVLAKDKQRDREGAPMSTIAAAAGMADRIDYWIRQYVIPYGIKAVRTVTESKDVESPRPPVRQPGGAFPT